MTFLKRLLIGLPIAIAFYFVILTLMWAPDPQGEYWKNLPEALVAFGTLMLAIAAFWSIQNSNQIEKRRREKENEERRLQSNRRRIGDLERWTNEVIRIRVETMTPQGTDDEWQRLNASAQILASQCPYVESEAARLDQQYPMKNQELEHIVRRISFIFEHHSKGRSLSNEQIQSELEEKCNILQRRISDIKASFAL